MTFDRTIFFKTVRSSLFDGTLRQGQVEGITAILDRWARTPATAVRPMPAMADRRWLAYMLATAHHETGRTMQPVRETFAASDDRAIAILDAAFRRGRLPSVSVPYWRRDADGKSWLGRGLVQLTHRANYEKMTAATGIDLVARPDLAMELAVSVDILFAGMESGAFTGRKLGDYFSATKEDWTGARRIINGRDRAALVAGYGKRYLAAILQAGG
ncbi:chitinase [Pararhizobium polonicum]|uniref:Chitinase n=1 Tax=Pararhizobium polonicum TaxID=1612624 RepID=A0A1C7P470_9HYPH|nr:glycoside hydrolase family 19 protein [Pararhizobium polonicum]OBZ96011.1 chitinase [Pararhizobium polonicum]